jgi:hypothetical protein
VRGVRLTQQIEKKAAVKIATDLFEGFGKGSAMEQVLLTFAAFVGTREWTFKVSRRCIKTKGVYGTVVETSKQGEDYDPAEYDPFG